ncbi:Hypothetical protein I5071_35110 [Sandaracinus amylolyticus]|nr:Hypothetical protein I5071_35110 [Sandaracinus amylolyticus]
MKIGLHVAAAAVLFSHAACYAPYSSPAAETVSVSEPASVAPQEPTANGEDALALARAQYPECADVRFDRWIHSDRASVNVCGVYRIYAWSDDGGVYEVNDLEGSATAAYPTSPPHPAASGGPVRVHGYYRRDGTYVHPHTRRRPR